jgi:hypothetical protein
MFSTRSESHRITQPPPKNRTKFGSHRSILGFLQKSILGGSSYCHIGWIGVLHGWHTRWDHFFQTTKEKVKKKPKILLFIQIKLVLSIQLERKQLKATLRRSSVWEAQEVKNILLAGNRKRVTHHTCSSYRTERILAQFESFVDGNAAIIYQTGPSPSPYLSCLLCSPEPVKWSRAGKKDSMGISLMSILRAVAFGLSLSLLKSLVDRGVREEITY